MLHDGRGINRGNGLSRHRRRESGVRVGCTLFGPARREGEQGRDEQRKCAALHDGVLSKSPGTSGIERRVLLNGRPNDPEQKSGTMIGFTSGAFAGSVAQANYSAAKGGIVSLTRSAAVGMNKYGVTANVIAPVAKSRMSGNVPFGLEMGEPEDVAPMVVFLLGDAARSVTGQVFTANGGKLAVWNQPVEVREINKDGRWTPEEIAERFDELGQERMGMLDRLEAMAKAATSGDKPNK